MVSNKDKPPIIAMFEPFLEIEHGLLESYSFPFLLQLICLFKR